MSRAHSHGAIRIGVSGWTYPPWRGVFYPKKLPQKQELAYASRQFRSIEINGTFYRLQRPNDFARWRDETPEDFVFAVKAPRYMTHILRLRDFESPLANFLASGLLRLGPKLGPILWQFPPSMAFDPDAFEPFVAALPHDTERAEHLARRRDDWLDGRDCVKAEHHRALRHAIEIRHESFRSPRFVEMLRKRGVALVCADTEEWPRLMDVTANFLYCRLHGSEKLYQSGYDEKALETWARRIRAWAGGGEPEDAERVKDATKPSNARDVFVFFDNDVKVLAPANAASLAQRLGVAPVDASAPAADAS